MNRFINLLTEGVTLLRQQLEQRGGPDNALTKEIARLSDTINTLKGEVTCSHSA